MDYYKINELAKVLDVVPNTIRRYEKMGYIKPDRVEKNGYRAYGEYELDKLIWTRMFRKYEFMHEDIYGLLNDDIKHLISSYEKRKAELDEQINYLRDLKTRIKGNIRLMKMCECGKYGVKPYEPIAMKYVLYTEKGKILKEEKRLERIHEFMYTSPETQLICVFSMESLLKSKVSYNCGIAVKSEYAQKYDLTQDEYVKEFPSKKCISFVIKVEGEFKPTLFDEAFEYINTNNLKITGDIFALKMAMVNENEKNIQYMMAFIPFEEK